MSGNEKQTGEAHVGANQVKGGWKAQLRPRTATNMRRLAFMRDECKGAGEGAQYSQDQALDPEQSAT